MKNKSVLRRILTGLFVVLVLAVSNSIVRAQGSPPSTNWIAGTGDWFTPANWSGIVPNASTSAHINNVGHAQINGGDAFAQSLNLGDNQGDSGAVTVDNSAFFDVRAQVGNCDGNIYVGNRGSGIFNILNGSMVESRYGYVAAAANPTRPASSGTVTVDPGAVWNIFDTPFLCTGAGLFIGCTANSNGAGGTAAVNVGGRIAVFNHAESDAVTVGLSGSLTGNGVVDLHVNPSSLSQTVKVYGTLAPTNGALTIYGKLVLTSSASTVCHVTPTTPNDKVYVAYTELGGTATLDGRLTVIMTGSSFTPGTYFTLVHADLGLNNTTFPSESIMYNDPASPCMTPTITYDANNVYLYLQPCD